MLFLLTRPKYDCPTHYLFHWAQLLIDEAKERKVDCIDLEKDKSEKKRFQSYLKKQPVDLVVINGHGNSESVTGHDNQILLSVNNGPELLKGKNVFIRACDAGSILGPHLMSVGAKGFVGYNLPFMFAIDRDSFHTPIKDEYAGPILECSNKVAISLIKGKTIRQAQEDSISEYKEKINKYSNSKVANSFILPFLFWNMNCQVCFD